MQGKERVDMERKGMAREVLGIGIGLDMACQGKEMQGMSRKGKE
jgi:hypothetical protein